MPKFLKSGKVVIVLKGKYAGRKAVIVRQHDDGTGERQYGHCVVAGIDRYPLKVARGMSKGKIAKRSRVFPFVKVVNYNHVMPTRFSLDLDLKKVVTSDVLSDPSRKKQALKTVRRLFQEKYRTGDKGWFFSKLAF